MNTERIKAIAVIAVTAAVNIANVCGYAVDADTWVNAALSVISAAAILYAWWKNNNLTDEAQRAQGVLDHLKAESKARGAGRDGA